MSNQLRRTVHSIYDVKKQKKQKKTKKNKKQKKRKNPFFLLNIFYDSNIYEGYCI